jgi:hypothetical protein
VETARLDPLASELRKFFRIRDEYHRADSILSMR